MRSVRVKIENMKKGDVFVAYQDEISCLVQRPINNMGKKAQSKHRKAVRLQRVLQHHKKAVHAASVDHIMEQLEFVM